MFQPTSQNIKNSISELMMNNGINSDALFQTSQRKLKYPGDNLFFSFTRNDFDDKLGLTDDHKTHPDIENTIDNNGNFKFDNILENIHTNRDNITEKFSDYPQLNPPIFINYDSFVNRRLQAGIFFKEEPKLKPTRLPTNFTRRTIRKYDDDDDDDDDVKSIINKRKTKITEDDDDDEDVNKIKKLISKNLTIKNAPTKNKT
jgi:hypothetical protein